jgi:hypothetical protein
MKPAAAEAIFFFTSGVCMAMERVVGAASLTIPNAVKCWYESCLQKVRLAPEIRKI